MDKINKYIDHTLLKANATEKEIIQLCREAVEYNFASVCVNSCYVSLAKQFIGDNKVGIATVVGFPLGATTTYAKIMESKQAVSDGATEIDMVINIGWAKDGQWDKITSEIEQVVIASGVIVKVILETCLLTKEEIAMATKCCVLAKAHYVKTSTGFSTYGARIEDVLIMKENCEDLHIKASGGIRDYVTAVAMIEAGATRLGTSAGIEIVRGQNGLV